MSRPEKKLVPVRPPRRKTHQMGVSELIPPALQYTGPNVDRNDPLQPGNATRIPWDGRPAGGEWDPNENTVMIEPNVAKYNQEAVLPHELGHAMWGSEVNNPAFGSNPQTPGSIPDFIKEQWKHMHETRMAPLRQIQKQKDLAYERLNVARSAFDAIVPPDIQEWDMEKEDAWLDAHQETWDLSRAEHDYQRLQQQYQEALRTINAPSGMRQYPEDPWHSWAETVGEYIGTPEQLERDHPWIYRWMRSVLGREYKQRDAAEANSPAAQIPFYLGSVE